MLNKHNPTVHEIYSYISRNRDSLSKCAFIILGRPGPTGKTWLCEHLRALCLRAYDLSESVCYQVNYIGDRNYYVTDLSKHQITIILNMPIDRQKKLVEYTYEVDVGSGCGTGSVFVSESATDDEIRLAILDDLYDVTYDKVEVDKNDET